MEYIYQKLAQYVFCMAAGLLMAIETTLNFFVPCLISIALDVVSAYFLGRRVHKKYPEKCDGKFKSEYKYRILYTMIIVFVLIILAAYVDSFVFKETDIAVRFSVGAFLFYELWSCLENWSSENDKPWAKVLQRIMVNKAERHLNVPLSDILLNENKDEDKNSDRQRPR